MVMGGRSFLRTWGPDFDQKCVCRGDVLRTILKVVVERVLSEIVSE